MSIATDVLEGEPFGGGIVSSPAQERSTATLPVTIIERRPGWHLIDLGELGAVANCSIS